MDTLKEAVTTIFGDLSLERVLWAVIIFIVLIIISKIAAKIISKVVAKTKMTEGQRRFVASVVRYVLYFVSILIACDYIGLPITSLLAVFSLLGLAISLSVQNLLSNLMSGLTVLMLKPFDVGDFIETEIAGTVKNIGLFYTEILTPDNKTVFIPNDKLMANKLINYNAEGTRRLDLCFNAEYSCKPEAVKAAIRDAIAGIDLVLKTPEPIIGIAEYGESAVIYNVWVWVKAEDYFTAKHLIMDAVGGKYKENGISMAYNRLQIEMINGGNKNG